RLAKAVDETAQKITRSGPREPLEIMHAIVDAAEKRIEPVGRGKYAFPFNRIHISVAVDSHETRARFEAVFGSRPTLHDRVFERLQAAGCEVTSLSVSTHYVDRSESDWMTPEFDIAFDNANSSSQHAAETIVADENLRLTIIKGVSDKPIY